MSDDTFAGTAPVYGVRTSRLSIRCWSPADAPLIKEAIDNSLDHLRPWMPWAHQEPTPLPEVEDRLAMFRDKFLAGTDWIYGILDADERRVLGGTGLHPRIGSEGLEIGYWISAHAIGNGYATEASAALTRVGFEIAGAKRIEIRCDPRNVASAAIPRRLGYRHVTTLEGHMTDHEGNPRDTMIWTLTREEYPSSAAAELAIETFDSDGTRLL
jgi:RimJ/RimL family protein N-acetyltransferase